MYIHTINIYLRSWYLILVTISPGIVSGQDVINIGGFSGFGEVGVVAIQKGFLEQENITVTFNRVRSSPQLMRNFINGEYDIIQTNADNVIAWAEGQGVDPGTNKFIIFMGGNRGLARTFLGAPGFESFDDIRGNLVAVDAINTGYTSVLVHILKEHGLDLNQDYSLKEIGNGSMRAESMVRGETAAGLVNIDEHLQQRGFKVLAQTQDYIEDYARGVTAARKDWANENHTLLVRYIRAMIRATDWLLHPANRQEAIEIVMDEEQVNQAEANEIYQEAIDPDYGYIPHGKIERSGIDRVIQLREILGAMKPPLPSADKYIDENMYNQAIDSM